MECFGQTKKLTRILNDPKLLKKEYGELADRIKQRLDDFDAAQNLSQIPSDPPPRCHPLKGDRKKEFAVDINGNYRIVFEGYDVNDNLSVNKSEIVTIQIISIEDYH